jgi:hypothetical protein
MVDQQLRDCLADAIHALVSGFITNDEFEDGLLAAGIPLTAAPSRWPDPAIGPIGEAAWCLYSDTHLYRLTGRHKLAPEHRREVLRWVLFLRSDLEYEWPSIRLINPALFSLSGCLLSLLTAGILPRGRFAREFAAWQRAGDHNVWPFIRRADYNLVYQAHCPVASPRAGAAGRA